MQRDDKQEQELRLLQLRFIGKILAGFTHESKNYLAIINESAGLMGDMIQMGKSSEKDLSEYLQIIRSVEDLIRRANDHFRALNRFAHRMDTELSSYNINESLEELLALLARFANQKKITLAKNFQEDIPSIYGNPALFQFVVFSFLDRGFSTLDKDSRLTLQTTVADHTVHIKIIPEGTVLEQKNDVSLLPFEMAEKIIGQLQGNMQQGAGGETLLELPLKAS